MNIRSNRFFFLFIFGLILVSCTTTNSKFLGEVEKLEESVASSEKAFLAVDTATIGKYLRTSNVNLQYFQDNNIDTLDKQTAILISDYAASRKSLRRLLEQYNDIAQEINYTKKQLLALKTDVTNNALGEEKFSVYYSSEVKAVDRLNELIDNMVQWDSSAIKMYESKSPPFEKILQNLKNNIEKQTLKS